MSQKSPTPVISPAEVHEKFCLVKEQMKQTIRGKDHIIDAVLVCLLAGGHILLEDLPGMGKTTIAYSLATSLDTEFARIQFTSDLLPSDVLGVSIYDEQSKGFVLKKGPLFTNILLADEINRASPKTQSSLLEVMDRHKVTIDGQTFTLADPFMVIATQNPIDHQSTFALPDSQMDRFLMRLSIGYPDQENEIEILRNGHIHYDALEQDAIIDRTTLLHFQQLTDQVFAEESILHYIRALAQSTREDSFFKTGISPRGAVALLSTSKATALYQGRDYIIPADVATSVPLVFPHRLRMAQSTSIEQEETMVAEKLEQLILEVPRPA